MRLRLRLTQVAGFLDSEIEVLFSQLFASAIKACKYYPAVMPMRLSSCMICGQSAARQSCRHCRDKRSREILAWIKEQQDRQPRFKLVPDGPRRSSQKPGVLKNRALQITKAAKSCPKGRRRCDIEVSAVAVQSPSQAAE
jgi:hypothetical protein